ncbi:MAG: PIN domain-containing protein [Candidatus Methylacidiphilales bacterium]|nr:PIN domain-containing protein [Candidatus Methylacidiphilales bacterium]
MVVKPVLADSSWYIDRLRAGVDPLQELDAIAQTREVAVCGVVRIEVGRGLQQERVLRAFQAYWDVMLYVPTDKQLWEEVETLAWSLARRGIHPPLPDLVIACCALKIDAVVLTLDRHFHAIPGLTVTERLV